MKSVTVLLSTYNGEKYIIEQLDSVLAQEGVDIKVLVRDDGSNDKTLEILQKYIESNNCISILPGNENLKPAKSFMELMFQSKETDYYAFCDQDDVWDKDKLFIAINMIERCKENEKPVLYFSNYRIVDEDLRYISSSDIYSPNDCSKYSSLVENKCTGCTAVFNKSAKNIIIEHRPKEFTMHDAWVFIVCSILGVICFDPVPHISYRQHQNNVIGSGLNKSKIRVLNERIKRISDRKLQPRWMNCYNFYECYSSVLSLEDTKKVKKVINYKSKLKNRIELVVDKEIKPTAFIDKIRFLFHVLWGTV